MTNPLIRPYFIEVLALGGWAPWNFYEEIKMAWEALSETYRQSSFKGNTVVKKTREISWLTSMVLMLEHLYVGQKLWTELGSHPQLTVANQALAWLEITHT